MEVWSTNPVWPSKGLELKQTIKFDLDLQNDMANHYSQPKGFVGRSICYKIYYDGIYYGGIVGGSSTRFLPGRNEYFDKIANNNWSLENIVNNLFFHIEKQNNKYPIRNFSQKVLNLFTKTISKDWFDKYNDIVLGFETLIELPRTGEIYKRNGWKLVGQTKGFTCKRIAGKSTDNWSGKRVWNTVNLRPKLVFVSGVN